MPLLWAGSRLRTWDTPPLTSPPSIPPPPPSGSSAPADTLSRSVAEELRANLLHRLRSGTTAFPGIVGFDDTVLPELETALLAGHDLVLLGERGQGKTRLMRTLTQLLDEWSPEVAGCEIHDDPYEPVCVRCRALAAELGDDLPIAWRHRDDRYTEKLATPDTSVGDLIGDVDPVKVAQGRTLGDPETVHYGLVPRANRGVFGLNELPDLAERIQVALFNVLEERDIQVRGYSLRLPLDVLLVATANPEDYTNRGRIITPLKDRFGAEIRTHYLVRPGRRGDADPQEADLVAEVRRPPARGARPVHRQPARVGLDRPALRCLGPVHHRRGRGGRRARPCGAPAGRTTRRPWPGSATSLPCCPPCSARSSSRWARRAASARCSSTCCGWRSPPPSGSGSAGWTCPASPRVFAEGAVVETGDLVPAAELLAQLGTVTGLAKVLDRLGYADSASRGQVAAAAEFVLEGLHLTRRIDKDAVGGRTVYGAR